MTYAVVENGIVTNLIEAEPDVAADLGALGCYDGCEIGVEYQPPHRYTDLELTEQNITDLELAAIGQGQSMTDLELMILEGNYV